MARRRKRVAGEVVYPLYQTATHIKTGERLKARLGIFLTHKEAEARRWEEEEKMVPGVPQYEYEYSIEPVATEILRDELTAKKKHQE